MTHLLNLWFFGKCLSIYVCNDIKDEKTLLKIVNEDTESVLDSDQTEVKGVVNDNDKTQRKKYKGTYYG